MVDSESAARPARELDEIRGAYLDSTYRDTPKLWEMQNILQPGVAFIRIVRVRAGNLVIYSRTCLPPGGASEDFRKRAAGWVYALHYSVACPEGEAGYVHVSDVAAPITPEAFDAARAAGWDPNSIKSSGAF